MPPIQIFIGYIGLFIQLVAVLTGVLKWKERNQVQQVVVVMLLISLTIQLLALVVGRISGNSLWLFHINGFLEFLFLWWVYKQALKALYTKWLLNLLVILYVALSIYTVLFLQSIKEFPSISRFAESILIIFFGISWFVQSLNRMEERMIYRTFMFWVSSGLLVYFAANILTSLFANLLIQETDYESWEAIWSVHNVFNVFLYICFIVAFRQKKENKMLKTDS